MSLKLRKVNAEVRDPETDEMIPAGLLGSDAVSTIEEARDQAIEAVEDKGEETLASIPDDYSTLSGDVGDLKTHLSFYTGNTSIKIESGHYINTSGDTVNIESLVSSGTYGYAVVDCSEGDIFTITGLGGGSPRLFAFAGADNNGVRPILNKAHSSMNAENDYIIAPANSEKLIVNVNVTNGRLYWLVKGKLIDNTWNDIKENNASIENIEKVVTFPNLANPEEYSDGYKTANGTTYSSVTYEYTGYIGVTPGETLYLTSAGKYLCAFGINKEIIESAGKSNDFTSYLVPSGVYFVQITFYKANVDSFMVSKYSDAAFVPFGTPVLNRVYIPEDPAITEERKLNYVRESGDLDANEYLLIEKYLPIKNGSVIQFSGNITGEFTGIEIGFTDDISQSDLTHFKIDSTKFYRVTSSTAETAHKLTISGNISITITQTFTHLLVDVVCNGQKYHSGNGWAPLNKMPYVKVLSDMTDCVFSLTATKNRKDIVIFGDSYVSYGESRWIYYLDNDDKYIENITIIGYSGEASENGYTNFLDFVPYSNAKYIVWAYGMNDIDSGGVVNATWKEKINAVIAYCKDHNMVPVLCTIPNVPSRDNSLKNAYVRTFIGTYPVIDFAKAVGSDISSNWYIAPNLASDSQTLSINHAGGYSGNITSVDFDGGTVTENALVDKIIMINNVPAVVVSNTASTITFASTNFGTINDDATIYPAKMLSTDNVHPTSIGAKALYNRAIADFPQLCVK